MDGIHVDWKHQTLQLRRPTPVHCGQVAFDSANRRALAVGARHNDGGASHGAHADRPRTRRQLGGRKRKRKRKRRSQGSGWRGIRGRGQWFRHVRLVDFVVSKVRVCECVQSESARANECVCRWATAVLELGVRKKFVRSRFGRHRCRGSAAVARHVCHIFVRNRSHVSA